MKQKWMAIANPTAGSGKVKRRWPEVRHILNGADIQYEWAFTNAPGDAARIVQKSIGKGFKHFISVGGDGTHHEVVNGICTTGKTDSKFTMGIIPIGTGNDWARTLLIPNNLEHAARIISRCNTISHSVGKVRFDDGTEEFFMNVAGMCMDAAVVQNVPASYVRKFGGLAYLIGGVRELFTYISPEAEIKMDSRLIKGNFLTMHAGFGKYCGGGMQFLPIARTSSESLAITTINAKNKWRLLLNIHRLFTGTILSLNVANSYTARRFRVQHIGDSPVPVEADGEFLGFSPFEITTKPNALRVCVS